MKQKLGAMEQFLTVDENTVFVTAATALTKGQRIVRATVAAANYAVTLPNVSSMAGEVVTVILDACGVGYALTVQDNDESSGWKDIVLNGAGQYVILLSDGLRWRVLGGAAADAYLAPDIVETFTRGPVFGGGTTGAPTGTAGDENYMQTPDGNHFEYHILGTQTITCPNFDATVPGLDVSMDAADNDGAEFSTGIGLGARGQFTVGAGAFFARMKFTIADVSDTDDCAFGFRKREAYQANVDDYDEMAALNVISGAIKIETILNNGATTTTDTTDTWADTESHELEVRVDKAGAVTYLIDGAAPTATAAFSFDAGEVVIPFLFFLHAAASTAGIVLQKFECGYL